MTGNTKKAPGVNKTAASLRQTPLEAMRKHCLKCSGDSFKAVLWCACTHCILWIFRFGRRPESMPRELVTPSLFGASLARVDFDELPNGVQAAAEYLAERKS